MDTCSSSITKENPMVGLAWHACYLCYLSSSTKCLWFDGETDKDAPITPIWRQIKAENKISEVTFSINLLNRHPMFDLLWKSSTCIRKVQIRLLHFGSHLPPEVGTSTSADSFVCMYNVIHHLWLGYYNSTNWWPSKWHSACTCVSRLTCPTVTG